MEKLVQRVNWFSERSIYSVFRITQIGTKENQQQNIIFFQTRTILKPRLDVMAATEVQDIPKSVYNITQ